MTDTTTANADASLFDIRPAVAWVTDIQKAILVEGREDLPRPEPGAGIGDQLLAEERAAAGDVRITINDVNGREIRALVGTKNAGLNRVQWDLRPAGAGGRGRGQGGGGGQAAAGAPATPPAEGAPAPPQPAPQQAGRGRSGSTGDCCAGSSRRGGGGGGRGGFGGPPVAAGSYLVKLMVGDKVIGQKTIVVEADTTFMQ